MKLVLVNSLIDTHASGQTSASQGCVDTFAIVAIRGFGDGKDGINLQTFRMVIRTREINGAETGEVQYYLSSIKRDAKLFATGARGHLGIENTCHWIARFRHTRSELAPAAASRTMPRSVSE